MKLRPLPLITLLVCASLPVCPLASVFSPQEREMVKKGLLHRLGLTREPRLTTPTLPVPDHLWDIYNDVMDEENDADWIRNYYPTELLEENQGLLLSYNLSMSVRNATVEEVRRADLKIRLQSSKTGGQVKAYYVPEHGKNRLMLDSRAIDPDSGNPQWMDLDVTEAFLTRLHPSNTVSFWLELPAGVSLSASPVHSMSSVPYSAKQSAALVVQSDLSEPSRVRRKRTARGGRRRGRKQHRLAVERGLCQKKELYVDFEELNWQDWILAPKGYEAGQCGGSCPHPMPAHLNATNHAIIQSLLHSLNPMIPPPSCIPTETSPLAILYMDLDNRIVIKNYPDMRVEACGCR